MFQNLDRLKVFYHVFSLKSVVAAANVLHVSQSAVSQALQKLEKEIKTPLFIRLHKQLVPTAAGQKLYGIVEPCIEQLDIYLRDLDLAKKHPMGELCIGAPPEFGKAYLPAIVAGFRKLYPAVTFTLKFGTPDSLLPRLRKGTVDFALIDLFLTRNAFIGNLDMFHFHSVVDEEVILACSKAYYDNCVKDDLTLISLLRQDFISYRKDLYTLTQWFKHHFSKSSIQVQSVLTVDSHEAVISAIRHEVGMGIVASHLVKEELRTGEFVHIKTSRAEIINSISLVHLQEKIPTFTEKTFEKFLINQIKVMTR